MWQKGFADRIQLRILRWANHPGSSEWDQCDYKGPCKWREGDSRVREADMKTAAESDVQRLVLLPLKMEERGKPRDAGTSRSWKRQEMAFLATQIVKNLPAMQKTQVQSLGQEEPLEKEMATQYSCLKNLIDREKPGGLHRVHGVTRVRHDLGITPPPPEQLEGPSPADALSLAPMRPHGLLTSLTERKQMGVVLCT